MSSSVRVGLKSVSSNSPALSQLQLKKDIGGSATLPGKILLKTPVISPSPLASCEENKENTTQTPVAETSCSSAQTEVSAVGGASDVTAEDLESEKVTTNYLRSLAEEYEKEIENQLDRSLSLSFSLDQSISELRETEEQLNDLKEVIEEGGIELEQDQ